LPVSLAAPSPLRRHRHRRRLPQGYLRPFSGLLELTLMSILAVLLQRHLPRLHVVPSVSEIARLFFILFNPTTTTTTTIAAATLVIGALPVALSLPVCVSRCRCRAYT
ncbi:unnamed protein product, partial [Ectocarpus sp. 4 AP-2014]